MVVYIRVDVLYVTGDPGPRETIGAKRRVPSLYTSIKVWQYVVEGDGKDEAKCEMQDLVA